MQKIILLIILLVSLGTGLKAQDFVNAFRIGGEDRDWMRDIMHDDEDNLFIAGGFQETVDLDPGAGINLATSEGDYDMFISKLDENNDLIWSVQIGSEQSDFPTQMKQDGDGFIYVCGSYEGDLEIETESGTVELFHSVFSDLFICKISPDGEVIWVRGMGGTGTDFFRSLAVDDEGDIYCVGYFENTLDFDPGVDEAFRTAVGEEDCFVLKLNSDGEFIWVRTIGNSGSDQATSLVVDQEDNICITGRFSGTVDFDLGDGEVNFNSGFGYKTFVWKLTPEGDFIWARVFEGANNNRGGRLEVKSDGNFVITGEYGEIADFDPGDEEFVLSANGQFDCYLVELSSSGDFVWATSFGGADFDLTSGLIVNESNAVYLTGGFSETVNFGSVGDDEIILTSNGNRDNFVVKLDEDGELLWARGFGGEFNDYTTDLSLNSEGNIFIGGYFFETVDFDPDDEVFELETASIDWADCFVLELKGAESASSSISESFIDNGFKVFPNPSQGVFSIDLKEELDEVDVSLTDVLGNVILQNNYVQTGSINLNVEVPNGVYFLTIESEKQKVTTRIVVQ